MIRIHRTDTKTFEMEFYDIHGNPVDLTGKSVRFVVKKNLEDPDSSILINKIVSVSNNIATVQLTSTDTDIAEDTYMCGFIIEDSSTHETVYIDKFQILPALKRAI